jgi:hypothetical protein
MGSLYSRGSDSDAGSSQLRKRKHDGRSASDTRPPSKRSLKSKTSDLNPVIISNALNSTLNRLADMMEKTLDATATAIAPTAPPMTVIANTPPAASAPSSVAQPSSQPPDPSSNPPLTSSEEILNQAIRVTTSDKDLSEDHLLAASLFFTSASEDAIRTARTYITLGNNEIVQRRFLLLQLDAAALLPGKGKGRAAEEDHHSMMY